MECILLNNCSLGVIPVDLMRPIVLQSNWRGAMAVALSCRFWYKEFREKIVHPMIAVMAKDEWWMFRRGQIYGGRSSCFQDREFNTIGDILKFKEYYQAALKNEERIKRHTDFPSTSASIMKIREVDGEESILTRDTPENSLKINLLDSFINDDVIYNEANPKFLDERPGNVITIAICHSISPSIVLEVCVDIWGNIRYSYVRCRAATRTEFTLKRDPKLFFDLKEILVYTKHAKAVVFPKEEKNEDHRSFRASYVTPDAKKTYQVQHLIVTKERSDQVLSVVTNDYKKDAIAKIIRLLSSALAGTLDRYEMNDWASETSLPAQWNPLLIQPIKLQSSLKDEGISCIESMHFVGRASKRARLETMRLDIAFDGRISLEIYRRNAKNRAVTTYEKEMRYPDIKKLQQFFNEFEVVEKVRNSRDNTEKSYKKLDSKERARIEKGKVTQKYHEVTDPFCGTSIFSASYHPMYLKDNYTSCRMSPRGFALVWKYLVEMIKEVNLVEL